MRGRTPTQREQQHARWLLEQLDKSEDGPQLELSEASLDKIGRYIEDCRPGERGAAYHAAIRLAHLLHRELGEDELARRLLRSLVFLPSWPSFLANSKVSQEAWTLFRDAESEKTPIAPHLEASAPKGALPLSSALAGMGRHLR